MRLDRLVLLLCATLLVALSGCAAGPSPDTAPPEASVSAPSAPVPAPVPAAKEVPALKVVDCKGCSIPGQVHDLIIEGYSEAAAAAGMKISNRSQATLTIASYRQRPPAKRAMMGVFAGKDEIRAVVTHEDKRFEVGDYYANALQGMNALSKRIGAMAFEKMRP